MRILFIGDIIGRPGRKALARHLPRLSATHQIDFVIANGENAAGGLGASPSIIGELFDTGVHAITLGNHTWRKKELAPVLDSMPRVIRPANFPASVPGRGAAVIAVDEKRKVGIVNLVGRVYMPPAECPFLAAMRAIESLEGNTPVILVDIHAEATSEKVALGWYLDGHCSAVVGTHTHVQTADECILPNGTAYITDAGMTGPFDSVIGVEREPVLQSFLTGMPSKFQVAKGRPGLNAVMIDVCDETGKASAIRRIAEFES